MARSAEAQKKEEENLRERFNRFLDNILTAGPKFSMAQIQAYADAAEQARQHRMREARPVVMGAETGRVVPRRGEMEIPAQMTRSAIEGALDLAERLELAANARELDIGGWVRAGRG